MLPLVVSGQGTYGVHGPTLRCGGNGGKGGWDAAVSK